MANPTWGMLAKGQGDDETIEQAIERLIAEHEADEEAHLGAGQSLQSHKASEIIDHLAESIVADKIGPREVIVDHLYNDRYYLRPTLESVDGWMRPIWPEVGAVYNRVGEAEIYPGDNVDDIFILLADTNFMNCKSAKNPEFEVDLLLYSYKTRYDCFVTMGAWNAFSTAVGFGFKWYGGTSKMYTWYRQSGSAVETEIEDYDDSVYHTLRAVLSNSGNNIKFYVDDELVQEVTSAGLDFDLPYFLSFGVKRISSDPLTEGPIIREPIMIQDK